MVFGVLILGLIVAAVVAVLRSEHTTAAKAAMLLLTFLVPILGAIFALALAGGSRSTCTAPTAVTSSRPAGPCNSAAAHPRQQQLVPARRQLIASSGLACSYPLSSSAAE